MSDPSIERCILVGWDGSEHAEDALELGHLLAAATGARLVAAEVAVDRLGVLRRHLVHHAAEPAAPAIDPRLAAQAEPRAVVSSSPGHGLHDLAEELDAELIVIGSTHRGPAGRVFLGTVADDLIHGAPCAVAIAPRRYAKRFGNRLHKVVVAAFDASPEARTAAFAAARIAKAVRATVRIVAVLEPPPLTAMNPLGGYGVAELTDDERRHLEREVEALVAELPPEVAAEGRVVSGHPVPTLADEAAEVDLLVVGSRGYGPVGRTLLGSVSSEVVRSASCPVLIVPRGVSAP